MATDHIERMHLAEMLETEDGEQLYRRCMESSLLRHWTKFLVTYERATQSAGYTVRDIMAMPLNGIEAFVNVHYGTVATDPLLIKGLEKEWTRRLAVREQRHEAWQKKRVDEEYAFHLEGIAMEEGRELLFAHMVWPRKDEDGELFYDWVCALTFFRLPGAERFSYNVPPLYAQKQRLGLARILREADAPDAEAEKILSWAKTLPPYNPW